MFEFAFLVLVGFVAYVAWLAYRSGKQIGSRKGFSAGRRRGHRDR